MSATNGHGQTDGSALLERPRPVLELSGISAGYGRTKVLRDVDLTVRAGSVVALLGPNGAGKTTLLRVAAACSLPPRGESRSARMTSHGDGRPSAPAKACA